MHSDASTTELIHEIHRLWSASYHGILSTHSIKFPGYPFGSLIPICRDAKGGLLLLISHLAQHTKNLENDSHCALTVIEQGSGDVQQLSRLTCLARAEAINSSAATERYFRHYPETLRYQKELNFRFYRLEVKQFYYVGGFGAVRWFDPGRIPLTPPFSTADEAELLSQLNTHKQDLLNPLIRRQGMSAGTSCEAVGADPSGLDIRFGAELKRLQFENNMNDKSAFLKHIAAIAKETTPTGSFD